jgi:hypothetical protein
MKRKPRLPRGWSEKRIQTVIDHYENQTEDEQFAEIEAARTRKNVTMMAVPTKLVPKVRALITKKRSA